MEKHRLLNDIEFEEQFATASLDPTLFSHEAHLRLAWIHIHKYGLEQACENICTQIQQFDLLHGGGKQFNKTVTVAAVKIVFHFIQKSKFKLFTNFIQAFPRLKNNFMDLLNCHYGFNVFSLEKAKKEFLEPDLLPFD